MNKWELAADSALKFYIRMTDYFHFFKTKIGRIYEGRMANAETLDNCGPNWSRWLQLARRMEKILLLKERSQTLLCRELNSCSCPSRAWVAIELLNFLGKQITFHGICAFGGVFCEIRVQQEIIIYTGETVELYSVPSKWFCIKSFHPNQKQKKCTWFSFYEHHKFQSK